MARDFGWILIPVLTLFALFWLYAAANTHDVGFGFVAAGFVGFSVLLLFRLIAMLLPHHAGDR